MLGLVLLAGCRVEVGTPTAAPSETHAVWVYTSMYQEVIDAMGPMLARELPGVTVEWFQSGSEKVAQRWEAEHEAGGSRACLLATSDPSWYAALTTRDLLLPYVSPRALALDRRWVTPTYAAFRLSLMVLSGGPTSLRALADPAWKDQFSTPDPMSSGTMFTTLATWDAALGWEQVRATKANGWVAAGGSSAVLSRMQSGERPVGVALYENLLSAGLPATIPAEGAVPVAGPLAIPRDCPDPEGARLVYDWLMGEDAARAVADGRMHSPFPGAPTPKGALPLAQIPLLEVPTLTQGAGEALKLRWQGL